LSEKKLDTNPDEILIVNINQKDLRGNYTNEIPIIQFILVLGVML